MQQHHHRPTFVALRASCIYTEELYQTLRLRSARGWGCPACFPLALNNIEVGGFLLQRSFRQPEKQELL
jgi:hypothetical protein